MVIFDHMGIARTIAQTVEQNFSLKLDTRAFIYGSIKPDLSSAYSTILHYKEDSFDYVMQEIRELMNDFLDGQEVCPRAFSEKLGVVTHYLADYFCYVHNSHFKGSMFTHLVYELKLFGYGRWNARQLKANRLATPIPIFKDEDEIGDYLEKLHQAYMKQPPGYELDLTCAYRICSSLCLSVIASCTKKQQSLAA